MSGTADQNQAGAPPPADGAAGVHTSPDATSTPAAGTEPALTREALAAETDTKNFQQQQDDSGTATEHAETLSQARSPSPEPNEKITAATNLSGGKAAAGGRAVINQRETIPTTGKRIPTTKWEYITFCIFCKHWTHNAP